MNLKNVHEGVGPALICFELLVDIARVQWNVTREEGNLANGYFYWWEEICRYNFFIYFFKSNPCNSSPVSQLDEELRQNLKVTMQQKYQQPGEESVTRAVDKLQQEVWK